MNREQRLRIIADEHTRWEQELEGKVAPDPEYSNRNPSQYPETIVTVSASPAQQDEFVRRLRERGAL